MLVLSTHPEYWTREMYPGCRGGSYERGGKLVYLGGNGLNCEVEFLDADAMTVHNLDWGAGRPSSRAASTCGTSRRPGCSAWRRRWPATKPGRPTASSTRALGVRGHRADPGDVFGTASLDRRAVGGASGHETDKLTASAPANMRLLAKGMNPDDGGADMVYFDTPSGGAVFSVGSISYTCSVIVDDAISVITGNVLRRFLQ